MNRLAQPMSLLAIARVVANAFMVCRFFSDLQTVEGVIPFLLCMQNVYFWSALHVICSFIHLSIAFQFYNGPSFSQPVEARKFCCTHAIAGHWEGQVCLCSAGCAPCVCSGPLTVFLLCRLTPMM